MDDRTARAFDEWMRRYISEPERFAREFRTIAEFTAEEERGEEPSYGRTCAAYLHQLMQELDAAPPPIPV